MSITLGDAILWLRADDTKLESDLRGAESKTKSWMGGLGGIVQTGLGFVLGGAINAGIGAITSSFGALKNGMIGGNAAFEQYNTQFEVLLGSAEAAKERMADLAEFGQKTPFELPEVVEADRILQGFGLHSKEAAQKFGFAGKEIRTIAGDVASGTGSSFQEMALLIGKFSSGATGEAISRMQELGITNREELAKMGLEFSKSGQLLSPLPEAMNVVLGLMKQKYGGLMDAQSRTFTGMMSNLSDWVSGTLRTIGQPIFELLKDKLQVTLEFLGSPVVQNSVTAFAQMLTTGIGVAMDWINTTAIPALQQFHQIFRSFASSNIASGIVRLAALTGLSIKQLVGYVTGLIGWVSVLRNGGQQLMGWITGTVLPAIQAAIAQIDKFINAFSVGFASMGSGGLNSFLSGLKAGLLAIVPPEAVQQIATFMDWLQRLRANIELFANSVRTAFLQGGLSGVFGLIISQIQAALPDIQAALAPLADMFWAWVGDAYINLPANLTQLVNGVSQWLTTAAPQIRESTRSWAGQIWGWVTDAAAGAYLALQALIIAIFAWASSPEGGAALTGLGNSLGQSLIDGLGMILQDTGSITSTVANVATAIGGAALEIAGTLILIGGQLAAGLIEGIIEKLSGGDVKVWTVAEMTKFAQYFTSVDWGAVGSGLMAKLIEGIRSALPAIGTAVDEVIAKFNPLQGIQIPDWLTPGSPTPFELGLRGITSAINTMPEINIGGANLTGANPLMAGAGGTSVGDINISIDGAGDPASVGRAVRKELETLFSQARR